MSPECLKGELITSKSDIWSLGILIYYMLYKKYPYNGTEVQILNQIQSNQILININDKYLNDLLNKMLKVNINERISWEEYFQHPFFNSFICYLHLNIRQIINIRCMLEKKILFFQQLKILENEYIHCMYRWLSKSGAMGLYVGNKILERYKNEISKNIK
jgi:serine/threonine protein kinase